MFGIFNRKCSVEESGLLGLVEDRHSHILYGVDDGVKTAGESAALLEWLYGLGLKSLWLTPHVMEDIPNTTDALRLRMEELVAAVKPCPELHLAAEYMIDNLFLGRLESGDLLCMEDGQVLVETSTWSSPFDLPDILSRVMSAGYRPVLAHPERYRYMEMEDYGRLAGMGVRLQLNLPSLLGYYGDTVQAKARKLLSDGLYSFVGSDCHGLGILRKLYSARVLDRKDADMIAHIGERN